MPSPYFDLQVNGYAGVDFNHDDLTADQLHAACTRLADDGNEAVLATIITDTPDRMTRRLANLARLRAADPLAQQIIAGLHVEGPFISPLDGYRGAHPADAVTPADTALMHRLLDAAQGLVRLVTLAPEHDHNLRVTRLLAEQNIAVAAGHTDASLDQLQAAADAGLSLFTHLGNGCPNLLPRHDNIIQRALALRHRLHLCFIADGAHIPFFALANYLRAAGTDRSIIVTDAVAPAGLGPGRYTLGRWNLHIGPDMVARAPDRSHLIGSAITMPTSAKNLAQHLHLTPDQIHQLTHTNPRRALRLDP